MFSRLHITNRAAALIAACSITGTIAVLGCGESSSTGAASWDGVVRDSAGIQIVENFGTPLWTEGEGWEFTEVLRIGAATGQPEYEFGRISGLAVLSDRRVVVADALGHHVKYFSPEGVHERTVGTVGRGPGDFGGRNLALFRGPGDTLLVVDQQNSQGHTLAPDGTWLGSFSMLPMDRLGPSFRWSVWDDDPQTGRIVSKSSPVEEDPTGRPAPSGTPSPHHHIVFLRNAHGAVLDTVVHLSGVRGEYFPGVPVAILCCGVLVTGHTDEYRFLWYELDGTLSRIVTLAREPLAMTGEDQSVLVQMWERTWRERGWSPESLEREKSRYRFKSTYPAYGFLRRGPAGTFLVQQVRPIRDLDADERNSPRGPGVVYPPGSPNWDVFDREGRYLGVVVQGTGMERGWAGAHLTRFAQDPITHTWYVYSVVRDEMDVEYVVVRRVDGPMPE